MKKKTGKLVQLRDEITAKQFLFGGADCRNGGYPDGLDGFNDFKELMPFADFKRLVTDFLNDYCFDTQSSVCIDMREHNENCQVFDIPNADQIEEWYIDQSIKTEEFARRYVDMTSAMNDEIREEIHSKLSPCTDLEFLRAYVEQDPEFLVYIHSEHRIIEELLG